MNTSPRGSSSCLTSILPSLTRCSTETKVVRFSWRSAVYRSASLISPGPRDSILLHTASTSLSSSSSWALPSNFDGSLSPRALLTRSLSLATSSSFRASSNAPMSSYTVTGRSVSLANAGVKLTSGTNRRSSSKKNESSASSTTSSTGGSLLSTVASDCILRILQAIRRSLPATIMSNLSSATFRPYMRANSERSTSQGSMPLSSTRLNTARIDSSTGSCSLSPDSARESIPMYLSVLLRDSSSSAMARWNSRCCSSSDIRASSIVPPPARPAPPPRTSTPRRGRAAL